MSDDAEEAQNLEHTRRSMQRAPAACDQQHTSHTSAFCDFGGAHFRNYIRNYAFQFYRLSCWYSEPLSSVNLSSCAVLTSSKPKWLFRPPLSMTLSLYAKCFTVSFPPSRPRPFRLDPPRPVAGARQLSRRPTRTTNDGHLANAAMWPALSRPHN